MVLTTDHDGKAWIETQCGDATARFAITSDGGVAFGPYRQIELDDARIERVTAELLRAFGAESVPIEAT